MGYSLNWENHVPPGPHFHQQPRKLGAEGRLGKSKRKAMGFSGLCGGFL